MKVKKYIGPASRFAASRLRASRFAASRLRASRFAASRLRASRFALRASRLRGFALRGFAASRFALRGFAASRFAASRLRRPKIYIFFYGGPEGSAKFRTIISKIYVSRGRYRVTNK